MNPQYIESITAWIRLNCAVDKPLMWTLYKSQEAKASAPVASVQNSEVSYEDSLRQLLMMVRVLAKNQSYCTITCKSALTAAGYTCTFELTETPATMAGIYGMGSTADGTQWNAKYEAERERREKLEKELDKMKLDQEWDERIRKIEEKYQKEPSMIEKALENPAIMGLVAPLIQQLISPGVAVAGVGEGMPEQPQQAQPQPAANNGEISVDYNTVMTICHLLTQQGYNQPHQVLALCVQHPEEFKEFVHSVTNTTDGKDN